MLLLKKEDQSLRGSNFYCIFSVKNNTMKQFILTTSLLLISIISFSQSVTQGNILVNGGFGIGIYSGKLSTADTTETAVPGLLSIGAGYAITDDIIAGVRLERNGYIVAEEDSNKITSINPSIFATYNIVNSDKATLYFTAEYGYSRIRFISEDKYGVENNVSIKSKSGGKLNFDLGTNIYFSDNIGMFFNVGYAMYSYNKLTYHNDQSDPTDLVWTDDGTEDGTPIKFKLSGVNIRTGLAFKF